MPTRKKCGIFAPILIRQRDNCRLRKKRDTKLWEGTMALYAFIAVVAAGIAGLVIFRTRAVRMDNRAREEQSKR